MGATVVACASSAEKLQACKESGADILINYSLPGFKERIRKEAGGPLDVVYDPVGGEWSEPALRALCFGWEPVSRCKMVKPEIAPYTVPQITVNIQPQIVINTAPG